MDGDGIPDALEDEIARHYAPIVILDRRDRNRPASVPWLLAQAELGAGARAALAKGAPPAGIGRFHRVVRQGSDDPDDWVTYVHVFPRADGGVSVQYWFFYPYNDGPLFFNHESDWEHLTVRLDADGNPIGADLARHEDNKPGKFFRWNRLRRVGNHPVVLSARGTHATYADHRDLPWWEKAGRCPDLERCEHPVWRTWEGGGLENLGERRRPRMEWSAHAADAEARAALKGGWPAVEVLGALVFAGRWGPGGLIPGTAAPRGPFYQRGFCHSGFAACRENPEPSSPALPVAATPGR